MAEYLTSRRHLPYQPFMDSGHKYLILATFTAHCIIQAFQAKKIEVPKVTPDTFESVGGKTPNHKHFFSPPTEMELLAIEEEIEEIGFSNGPMLNALENLIQRLNFSRLRPSDIGSGATDIHRSFREQAQADALDKMWDVETK